MAEIGNPPDLRTSSLQLLRMALQPEPLQGFSSIIANLLKAQVASVTVFGPTREVVALGSIGNADPMKSSMFIADYQFTNPLRDFWNQAAPGETLRMEDAFRPSKMRATEFYSAYADDLDIGKGVCMAMPFSKSRVLIAASRPVSPGLPDFDLTPLRALMEDISLALEVSGAIWRSQIVISNLLSNFNQSNYAVAILDETGDAVDMNDTFRAIVEKKEIFTMRTRRLELGSRAVTTGFAEAQRRVQQTGKSKKLSLRDSANTEIATVIINPLPDLGTWGSSRPGKMILLCKPVGGDSALVSETLSRKFNFTPVESRVVNMLHAGHSVALIANMLNVQANTVRAHLKSVFAKTGTHSQVEVLGFLRSADS